ncbi:MAG: ankyrin repeat domain-containing protein [Elusimicrobiales bacterium]|jgi:ankyrin repeat protein
MKKYLPIIKDAAVLLLVSTMFVTLCNMFFKSLKKTVDADPVVTAMLQNNLSAARELLGDKGFAASKTPYPSLEAYQHARLELPDDFGRTPLMWTAYVNISGEERLKKADAERAPFAEFFIKSGAGLDTQDKDGWTALMWASWSGLTSVAGKLAEAGASLAPADRQGNTALMLAAMRGNSDIVRLLMDKRADRSAADKRGKKAVDLAREGLAAYSDKKQSYDKILALLDK